MTKLQENCIQTVFIVYNSFMSKTTFEYPMDRSQIVRMLQDHDVTPTRQRIEIADFLFQKAQHLSAENILDGVNAEGSRVSRETHSRRDLPVSRETRISPARRILPKRVSRETRQNSPDGRSQPPGVKC